MKIQKKIIIGGMSLLLLGGVLTSSVYASIVSGTSYQTASIADIPGGGYSAYNLTQGTRKATTGGFATFMKTYGQAVLGNYGELVLSSKYPMSEQVGLYMNDPNLASEVGCKVGSVYYLGVASHGYEPSNTCDITVKFSADNLKK